MPYFNENNPNFTHNLNNTTHNHNHSNDHQLNSSNKPKISINHPRDYYKQFNHFLNEKKKQKHGPLISVNGVNGYSPSQSNYGLGNKRFDINFKVLLLGNSGVGKTSILRSLVGEAFYQTTISTIGIDLVKKIFVVENHRIQLEVWDTAGQEQYFSIVALHFREAKAFIIVYDITDSSSFEQIHKYWLTSIDKYIDDAVPIFFVGNKVDLSNKRKISIESGKQLNSQQSAHGFFETSAKTGINITELFQKVAESMVSTWGIPKRFYEMGDDQQEWANENNRKDVVQLSQKKAPNLRVNCCNLN